MVGSVMSDPLGLSIGTTNLVAARVGNPPVTRRSVLTCLASRAGSRRAVSAHRRHRAERLRRARRRPRPAGGGRRILPSGRPAGGRGAAGDGLRHRPIRRRRLAVAVPAHWGTCDAAGAAHRDAGQPEPRAQRRAGPAGVRRRRLADRAARQSRAGPTRRGGAAGLRRRRHQHHVGRRRVVLRADRRHRRYRSSPAIRSTRRC